MLDKYRVHEVAKDLGVPSKEVVELLGEYYPDSPKGHMSALAREELSMVLEHYTQKSQIEDVDGFFEDGRKRRELAEKAAAAEDVKIKAAEKIAEEKTAKEKAESAKLAAKVAKPAAKKVEPTEAKPAEKAAVKAVKPIAKPAAKKAEPTEVKPAQVKSAEKPVAKAAKPAAKSTAKPATKTAKPAAQPAKKPAAKPAAKREMKTITPAASKQKAPVIQTTEETDTTKRVDMRTVKVNLDKYNERYETIAPENIAKEQQRQSQAQEQSQQRRRAPRRRTRNGKPILSRQEKEAQRKKHQQMEKDRREKLQIQIPDALSVADLADRLKVQVGEIVRRLMTLGIMASAGEIIDYDTAALVAMEIGATVEPEVIVTIEDRLFEEPDDADKDLVTRPPVVVVMGHVDHGKTSTLDAIRKTRVTSGEAGGITQHIGAYQVEATDGRKLTFLDTPGHAAFTSMRSRGAQITDIAVIVVAADDGVMPQTIEAINHAKDAGVTIIVAVNKIDKPDANTDRVLQELTQHGLVPEAWGGDTICVPISAKTGEGLDELLEMIQLSADVLDLKANPNRNASGTVIEARLDRGRGPVATLLIQSGTLHATDHVIAGSSIGRVRALLNDQGEQLEAAGPSTPIEITGLSEVPQAGDVFRAVNDERLARELAEQRKHEAKEEQFSEYQKVTLENLFDQISEGEMKELRIIVKADVQGSAEALSQSLEKITNEEVRVRVIHSAVGAVNESDVMLAMSSNAIIIGFNIRPDQVARDTAKREDVDLRLYRVIYDAIDEIEDAMKGMLAPKYRDIELGSAEVRDVFKVSNVGTVAGSYVTEGKILRSAEIRVVRDGVIIADDKMSSLRRFKDDVREVAQGYECGIGLEKFNDLKVGDVLEAYEIEEYRD